MINVLKKHAELLFVVDRVSIRVAKINVIDSKFSCPGQIFFALIIDNINQVLNVLFFDVNLLLLSSLSNFDFTFSADFLCRFFKKFISLLIFYHIYLFWLIDFVSKVDLNKFGFLNTYLSVWGDSQAIYV
jgi:hypothetical protein